MLNNSLISIFERDLERLKDEINLFVKEADIWIAPGGINNSPGNLCLHICGNLKHFIGATLGDTNFTRDREKEFSLKNIPKVDLIKNIEETFADVKKTLLNLDAKSLSKIYPIDLLGYETTTEDFLIHLTNHLNYHLGQINYLRRILID